MAITPPERLTHRCPHCEEEIRLRVPRPSGDAPCPNCGHLLWCVAGSVRAVLYPVPGSHDGDAPARPGVVVQFAEHALDDPEAVRWLFERLNRIGQVPVRRDVVLDFRDIAYLSSSVLGKLIALRRSLHVHRNQLRLSCVSPRLEEAFRVTRLDKLFALDPVEAFRPAVL